MAMRNYGAMSDEKLMRCVAQLQAGSGEAVIRVQTAKNPGSLDDNRTKAEYEARKRGLIDSNFVADGSKIKTESKFCPECEKKKPFWLDDYICVGCRDDLDGSELVAVAVSSPQPPNNDLLRAALAEALGE